MAKPKRICSVLGCGKWCQGHGYCAAHYYRWRRHGDPLGGGTSPGEPLRWIESHADYDGDDCIQWPFARAGRGEGVVEFEGRQVSAANVMCRLVHGEAPTPVHESAHSCGNGHLGCMNPNHLRWATRRENMMDKIGHGTMLRGETHGMVKLTEDAVRTIRRLRGEASLTELSSRFGVTRSAISAIWRRKTWKWLSD